MLPRILVVVIISRLLFIPNICYGISISGVEREPDVMNLLRVPIFEKERIQRATQFIGEKLSTTKGIYLFSQGETNGNAELNDILSAKGANLCEMASMNIPIPPGFIISTQLTDKILDNKEFPVGFREEVETYVRWIERQAGYKFGYANNPLFLSVRSGSKYSMPGMLKTVTNIGLNDETVEGLARLSGNRHFAYDTYIRFILDYAQETLNIKRDTLKPVINATLSKIKVSTIYEAPIDTLKDLVDILKTELISLGYEIPEDPFDQLLNSIMVVIEFWNSPQVITYCERNSIPHDIGTVGIIEMMVFGNWDDDSATGVAFTRNPLNGEREPFGEILFNAQGKDIVGSEVTPLGLEELDKRMPKVGQELTKYLERLENRFGEVQDVEFTIQSGRLWILQTRGNEQKVTPLARVRILIDKCQEGVIPETEALNRVELEELLWLRKYLSAPIFVPRTEREVLARGIPASPGVAEGQVCLDREEAISLSEQGHAVILVLNQAFVQDEKAIKATNGSLTRLGGATSHAAIIARGIKEMKAVITGVDEIQFGENGFKIGETFVKEGDFIILDGNAGNVFKGRIEEDELKVSEPAYPYYERLSNWIEIKQKEKAIAQPVIETGDVDVNRIRRVVEDTLKRAREVLQEHPTTWRKQMQSVTFSLLWIVEDELDRKLERLTYEEVVLALRYIYREDKDILARLIHSQGLKHKEVLAIFNNYLRLEGDDFGIKLFNLMGKFNIGDLTDEEYSDFLNNSVFPIVRVLVRLRDPEDVGKYLSNSTNETIASIIEEAVRFISVYRNNIMIQLVDRISAGALDEAEGIAKVIAERSYDDRELRGFLLGTEDSHGRLSQKAAKWFNTLIDKVTEERIEKARREQLEKSVSVSILEDLSISREEYPKEIFDAVEDFTHEYYAYYGDDAEGEIDYQVSKILDFGYNFYHDTPSVVKHMRQCLEYSFVDDDDYYLKPALNLVFFSYCGEVADTRVIQKVFHAVSPKIVIAFLNYAAEVHVREPELVTQLLINPEAQKKQFYADILSGQSKERMSCIKSSLTPEALLIVASLEKELPNLDSMSKTQESTRQCL